MNPLRASRQRRAARRPSGVALMVALVMLVIIGIASVSIMRGALSSDLIANNTRVQTLAMQAAQIALRYCEDEAVKHNASQPTVIHVLDDAPERAWESFRNWSDDEKVNVVPSEFMESENSTFVLPAEAMPQCMVQQENLAGQTVYQVTARGFSPDYAAEDDGSTASGSVVWLQSLLRL